MKKFLLVLTLLTLSTALAFATTDASISSDNPAVGETIKIYVPNAVITAKVTDINADANAKADSAQKLTDAAKGFAQDKAKEATSGIMANIGNYLENFSENNPVKSGIETINNAVDNQAGKWYSLPGAAAASKAVEPYITGKNKYIYLGLGALALIIVIFLFGRRGSKRGRNNG